MSDTTYNRADIQPLDRTTLGASVCGASFAPTVKYTAIPAAKEVICGGVPGPQGETGPEGPQGPQGEQGPAGPTGPRGETGPEGPVGRNGINGKSAHELWVEQGNQGDIRAFLLSLVGPTGPQGEVGPKGGDGRSLSIKKTFASVTEMEQDTSIEEGELVVIATDINDEDNGKLFVKTNAGYALLVDLSGADGIRGEVGPAGPAGPRGLQGPAGPIGATGASGKSAYQTWLDLGNVGDEAAFIASLTGPRGPKGDTTNLGADGVSKYIVTLPHNSVVITQDAYKTFTHHSITQWGNIHLDFTPSTTLVRGEEIGRLPEGLPLPVELIEVNAIGSGGAVGQVYARKNGTILANNLIGGQRYIVNLSGYFR